MPRKVTISAEVGVLMKISSVPAAFEYWREWARKMLRLQKPEPCVDLMSAAACAPLIKPPPTPMLIVVTAAALLRKPRREETARPEKSMSWSLGKCVQPMRSHMMGLLGQQSSLGSDSRTGLKAGLGRLLVGTPTEKNRRCGLRCPCTMQAMCHALKSRRFS